jgi:hypothetical protein
MMTLHRASQEFTALVEEAFAAHRAGDTQIAETKYRQVLEADPQNKAVSQNLMLVLINRGRHAEALDICRGLRAIDPQSRELLENLVFLLGQQPGEPAPADLDDAMRGYEAILAKDGADEAARNSLSMLVVKNFGHCQASYRPTMISTTGRSATYFTIHFFEFLERRLSPYSKDYDPVAGGTFRTMGAFPNLRMLKVTLHGSCPGFERAYDGPHRQAWQSLVDANPPEYPADALRPWFDPAQNPRARLVLLYRNPLDQLISGFRKEVRMGQREDTPELPVSYALAETRYYIAQYFSFQYMKQHFPEQVTLVRFEDLIADPPAIFRGLLDFFGVPQVSPDLIRSACKSSSVEALARAEDRSGRPSGPGGAKSHFDRDRAGRQGLVLPPSVRAAVVEAFAAFDIPMSEFGVAQS